MVSRVLRLLVSTGLAATVLLIAPAAEGRSTENLSLYVSFFANGTIVVALPDGSTLGSTSGPPPTIPAGFYNLLFSGPGGCSALPYFHLNGPGLNISTDMSEGLQVQAATSANLLPSSTYTWSDDAFPGVVHTFDTSAVPEGSPPTPATSSSSSSSSGVGVSYPSIVGSDVVPSRGTLKATVSTAGKLEITFKGKALSILKPGKYTISVTDESSKGGLMLERSGHATVVITSASFTGKHSKAVNLTAGTWLFAHGKAKTGYSFIVN